MNEQPRLQPWEWARATRARDDAHFERRVRRCESIEHVRAAVKHEAERTRGARQERVARLNERIQMLSE